MRSFELFSFRADFLSCKPEGLGDGRYGMQWGMGRAQPSSTEAIVRPLCDEIMREAGYTTERAKACR